MPRKLKEREKKMTKVKPTIKEIIKLYRESVWRSLFLHTILFFLIFAMVGEAMGKGDFSKTFLWNLPLMYVIGEGLCIFRQHIDNKTKKK